MPTHMHTIEELQYFERVMGKAKHHAQEIMIMYALPSILGNIVLFKDPGEPILALVREGQMKNVLWVSSAATSGPRQLLLLMITA